jgi:restriction system protein
MQGKCVSSQKSVPQKRTTRPAAPIRQSILGAMRSSASALYNHLRIKELPSHQSTVETARRTLATIRSFTGEDSGSRVFGYLRKVDPTVFEEMVLTSLQDGGRFVKRNLRYSNDGGQDGQFLQPGVGWVLIQCKRYSAHINSVHVQEFSEIIKRVGADAGIFVHTGRTGAAAWAPTRTSKSNIRIISGDKLIHLLRFGSITI